MFDPNGEEDAEDPVDHVIGFDVLLNDITKFTMGLRVRERGGVMVLTDDGRMIGLPHHAYFDDEQTVKASLLKPPGALEWKLASDTTTAFEGRTQDEEGPVRFHSLGEPWWAQLRPYDLSANRRLWIAVVVPESDLLGDLARMRLSIALTSAVVLAIALWRAAVLARRYSRPIEALVEQSDRISQGDLRPSKPVSSAIREVQHLSEAHDRMRGGLESLMKLESDLQLARQIQLGTFPQHLPRLDGYQIGAWSEPAEETGGDTYDVVAYRSNGGDSQVIVEGDEKADGAVFLLADATGHGIGPALSVTEVRAMLHMAVRTYTNLEMIAQQMNEQLYADLVEGRFITTWLGELDTSNHTLKSLSAGQGPILLYRSKQRSVDSFVADTVPMGVLQHLEFGDGEPIEMKPGDILAVLSDGVFEASDPAGRQLGHDAVAEVISQHHRASPAKIIATLRQTMTQFTAGTVAAGDQTIVIIKRK